VVTTVPRFAALGHQESWSQISSIVGELRRPPLEPLTSAQIREVAPWIPPRTVSRLRLGANGGNAGISGIYVDTFITPDELAARPTRRILDKVRDGIEAAKREGVPLVTLGGFTSILAEAMALEPDPAVALTTGNTLTAALIVRGVERAARLLGRRLEDEDVLVIGATGDVGSACARVLNGRVRRLLLAARNSERLEREAAALRADGAVEASIDVRALLGRATIVVAAASTSQPCFDLDACAPEAIVCDAGYPKNMGSDPFFRMAEKGICPHLFWGGMGRLAGGIRSEDGLLEKFYRFPASDVAHGCMLEGIVLAMAQRYEAFSQGRGRITPARVAEMWRLAEMHGVSVAPLFDGDGIWPEEAAS
jgi:predicted amino acid dehydrogenase